MWYKTFFADDFQGLDQAWKVEWSNECIHFIGAYFCVSVSPEDIQGYRKIWLGNWGHHTRIMVKADSRWNQSFWLPWNMQNKDRFETFLDHNLEQAESSKKIDPGKIGISSKR